MTKTSDVRDENISASIFDNAPVGLILLDDCKTIISANVVATTLFGYSSEAEMQAAFSNAVQHEIAATQESEKSPVHALLRAIRQGDATVIEYQTDSGLVAAKLALQRMRCGDEQQQRILISLTEVTGEWLKCQALTTEQVHAEAARAELLAYKSALEQHAIVAATDRSGRITYVNQQFCDISKYTREELIGQKHSIVNSGYHPRSFFVDMWKSIARGNRWHGEVCNRAKDGTIYWVDTTIAPLHDHAGKPSGYVSIRFDISEQKRIEATLHAEVGARRDAETLLLDVIETVPDAIVAYDQNDQLLIFNSAYREFYPLDEGDMKKGAKFEDILTKAVDKGLFVLRNDTPQAKKALVAARLRDHKNPSKIQFQQLSDGRWLQVQNRRSTSGHIVGVRTDITALKDAEYQIKSQAERDPLTGLYNRSVLLDRLERELEKSHQSGLQGALVIMDLDGFKAINDTLGHDVGDQMLIAIGERLRQSVRVNDTIVRLGGDEFALILPRLSDIRIAERMMARIYKRLEAPLELAGRVVHPGASMGIYVFGGKDTEPTELMKNADIALYQAKARGRGRYCFFSIHMREILERRESTAAELRSALDRDELEIAMQPQFFIQSRGHAGFEALARWHHHGRDIPPSEFIPVAEQTGLILQLGMQVLEKSLGLAARLTEKNLDPGVIAVNVAASQLKLEGFAQTIANMLQRFNQPAGRLEIEVTENVLLDRSSEQIARSLDAIRTMGVGIALDDFGTGHASLVHMKRFAFDRLKIDRSFVSGIGTNADDEIIVRTIVNLAHSLNKSVVAEGIETAEQLNFMQSLRCDVGQGYLISVPLPSTEAEEFLRKQANPIAVMENTVHRLRRTS